MDERIGEPHSQACTVAIPESSVARMRTVSMRACRRVSIVAGDSRTDRTEGFWDSGVVVAVKVLGRPIC